MPPIGLSISIDGPMDDGILKEREVCEEQTRCNDKSIFNFIKTELESVEC